MTLEEQQFLDKVNSQINDYIKLGFNQYGTRIPSQSNPTNDVLENSISDRNITTLSVQKLLAGQITVAVDVGNGNVRIDGGNKRIVVNDGTNDRCLMGYLAGKF